MQRAGQLWPFEIRILAALDALQKGESEEWISRSLQIIEQSRIEVARHQPLFEYWLRKLQVTSASLDLNTESNVQLMKALFNALEEPFRIYAVNQERRGLQFQTARTLGAKGIGEPLYLMIRRTEEFPVWSAAYLALRAQVYKDFGDPLATRAFADLETFLAADPPPYPISVD